VPKSKASLLGLMAILVAGFALGGQAIPNWSAPATWRPTAAGGLHTLTDVTNPIPFIAITPCRVADTRGNGFVAPYGPPSLVADANRTFVIAGQCGIPSYAAAVSFNFGALNVGGGGDLRVFPDGLALPLVSTMNYNAATPNIANAAIMPLGVTKGITVRADAVSIDLIIDVNGYYYDSFGFLPSGELFAVQGVTAGGSVIYGENSNTAAGSRGVRGVASGTTGVIWGVLGNTNSGSAGSAGVMGLDNTPFHNGSINQNTWSSGATRGVAGSTAGVDGLSSGTFGSGVVGSCTDTAGNNVVYGYLGIRFVGPYAVLGEGVGHFTGGVVAPSSITAQPHPSDAAREIDYTALSGARSEVYFRGTAEVVRGTTTIAIPEDFRLIANSGSYSTLVTPVGRSASVFVVSEDENGIVVQASRDVTIHYVVYGEREAFKGREAIVANTNFKPAFEGKYFSNMPSVYLQMMTRNGTLNPDGTVNAEKLRSLGFEVHAESENPLQLSSGAQTQAQDPVQWSKIR
jgi:hypothetical protein